MSGSRGPIPVRIVTRADLPRVRTWLQPRLGAERWGAIGEGLASALGLDGVTEQLVAGCPCCVGALPMRVTLDRWLRSPTRPDGLVIVVAGAEHAAALLEQLAAPAYAAHVRLDADPD